MSSTKDTITELKAEEQKIWIEPPADIKRLVGRNYNTGREFPVWFLCTWVFGRIDRDLQHPARQRQGA